jgi:hypothetical protein
MSCVCLAWAQGATAGDCSSEWAAWTRLLRALTRAPRACPIASPLRLLHRGVEVEFEALPARGQTLTPSNKRLMLLLAGTVLAAAQAMRTHLSFDFMMDKALPYFGHSPQPAETFYYLKHVHLLAGLIDHRYPFGSKLFRLLFLTSETAGGPKSSDHTIGALDYWLRSVLLQSQGRLAQLFAQIPGTICIHMGENRCRCCACSCYCGWCRCTLADSDSDSDL